MVSNSIGTKSMQNNKTKYISKISVPLVARPVFSALFTLFASKIGEMGSFRRCFKAKVKLITQKLQPRLAPFTEGMKCATQNSPLLNLL